MKHNKKTNAARKLDELKIELKNIKDELAYEEEAIKLRKTVGVDIEKIKVDTPYNKKKELISKYISRAFLRYDETIRFYYLTIRFKTKTGEQNYAFSSNPHKMKRFIKTGEIIQSDEERDKIINNLEIGE